MPARGGRLVSVVLVCKRGNMDFKLHRRNAVRRRKPATSGLSEPGGMGGSFAGHFGKRKTDV